MYRERGNKMKDLSLITTGKGVVGRDSSTKGRGGASLGKKKFDLLSITSCGLEMVVYILYCECE